MPKRDEWRSCFFGKVKVPPRTSVVHAEALAHIAWKSGADEEGYTAAFCRWFRRLAERRPDLASVYVPSIYPVDEFRFVGPYKVR
jgi:hypothetical protein